MKFNKGQQRTNGSIDYIHVDLWVPARNPSHSGASWLFMKALDTHLEN